MSVVVGPFLLQEVIGRGGMCEVWEGIHQAEGVPVAIKVGLAERLGRTDFYEDFRSEVRAVAGLIHPSIVQVFDYGQLPEGIEEASGGKLCAGSPYLVMELAEGTLYPFRTRLRWDELYMVLLSLLDALAHAHARGVIHRDIKPENVLVSEGGHSIKLSDFGIAHAFATKEEGAAYKAIGTPAYMAPEQFSDDWRQIGPWTDLYALGCMIFALLCGHHPYRPNETGMNYMLSHQFAPLPSLPGHLGVPDGLEQWLHRLLQKKPAARFQRAADAAWALIQLHARWDGSVTPSSFEGISTYLKPCTLPPLAEGSGEDDTIEPDVLPSVDAREAFETTEGVDESATASAPVFQVEPAPVFEGARVDLFIDKDTPTSDGPGFLMREAGCARALEVDELTGDVTPTGDADERHTMDGWAEEVGAEKVETEDAVEVEVSSERCVFGVPPLPMKWRADERAWRAPHLQDVGLGLFGLRRIPFVDREAERAVLWEALLNCAQEKRAGGMIVRGLAGVGKSRLAQWLCERAHEVGAAHVLKARHSPASGPAEGLRPMLARYIQCLEQSAREKRMRIAHVWRQLDRLDVGGWQPLADLLAPPEEKAHQQVAISTPEERYEIAGHFLERLTRQRPVIVWIDDAHWGLDLVGFCRHFIESQVGQTAPVLFVLTVSDGELVQWQRSEKALDTLSSLHDISQLHVRSLVQPYRRQMLDEILGLDHGLRELLDRRTQGNPLFAVQLLGDWIQRGLLEAGKHGFSLKSGVSPQWPADLQQIWRGRLRRLLDGHTERDVIALELAAALGFLVDGHEWEEVCGLADVSYPQSLHEEMLKQRLAIVEEGHTLGSWSFAHEMLREALQRHAESSGRWRGHLLLCARWCASSGQRDASARRGRFLLEAGEVELALAPLCDGIESMLVRGQYLEAQQLTSDWKKALQALGERAEKLHWARLSFFQGYIARGLVLFEEAEAFAQQALSLATALAHDELCLRALLELGLLTWEKGDKRQTWSLFVQAEKYAQVLGERRWTGELHAEMGAFLLRVGRLDEAGRWMRQALDDYMATQDTLGLGKAYLSLAMLSKQQGLADEAEHYAAEAQESFSQHRARPYVASCLLLRGDLARMNLQFELSALHYKAAREQLQRTGEQLFLESEYALGVTYIYLKRYDEARRLLEPCEEGFVRRGQSLQADRCRVVLLACYAENAEWERWDDVLQDTHKRFARMQYADVELAEMLQRVGSLAFKYGERERALRAYTFCMEQWLHLQRQDRVKGVQQVLRTLAAKR